MSSNPLILKLSLLGILGLAATSCSLQEIQYVVLNVSLEGEGSGSIVETKFGGIDCQPDCQEAYPLGAELTLVANPLLGAKFQEWGGDCSGTGECRITMTSSASVSAKFGLPDHRLEVRLGNTGTGTVTSNPPGIICGYDCAEDYPAGRFVALTASAAKDSVFTGWGGECTGQAECRVKLDDDRVVTAYFERIFHELSVNVENPEYGSIKSFPVGIDCGSQCSFNFVSQTAVRLTPVPAPGAVFLGWGGNCAGLSECALTMTSSQTVTARFARNYRVSVSKTGKRNGTVLSSPPGISCGTVCDSEFVIGDTVSLSAIPDPGARFVQWSGDCTGSGPCELLMDKDHQVTAEFATQYVGVNVVLQGIGEGRVTSMPAGIDCGLDCTEQYPINSLVTLTASVSPGSEFRGWLGTTCAGTRLSCVFSLSATVSVYANFDRKYPLTVSLGGAGSGQVLSDVGNIDCGTVCQERYDAGTVVSLTALPEPGFEFDGWSGDCTGNGTCVVTMDGVRNVSANFEPIMVPVVIARTGSGIGEITENSGLFDCGSNCEGNVAFGSQLTFTAVAGPGSVLAEWLGACLGQTSCTVTIENPIVIGASFESAYRLIRAGSDELGSDATEGGHQVDEAPQRTISVSQNFWMKATEVTRGEWSQLMAVDPSSHTTCGLDCPVNDVTYPQVVEYLNRKSRREGLEVCYSPSGNGLVAKGPSCLGYRLPTEAEWEVAARAGTDTAFYNGDISLSADVCATAATLDFSGWHCGNSGNELKAVGQKLGNDAQLFDMSGNVWEMVQDEYRADSYSLTGLSVIDPLGPGTSTNTPTVVRGGAFDSYPRECRSAARMQIGMVAPNTVGFRPVRSNFRRVRPGSFIMGSPITEVGHSQTESPQREVTLSRALYVSTTELTQGEWVASLPSESNPSNLTSCGDGCPVEQIDYFDVARYANARSSAGNVEACYVNNTGPWTLTSTSCAGYRIPTEAEWEYLARAGTETALYNGELTDSLCADPMLDEIAWYCGNASGTSHPVGEKKPNAFGLYDMNGNVAEWTEDTYDANYYSSGPALDPFGPTNGSRKTIRGGDWAGYAANARSASRGDAISTNTNATIGARIVRNVCPTASYSQVNGVVDERFRRGESVIWTEEEVLIFGGEDILSSTTAFVQSETGYAYNLEQDSWRNLPWANAPTDLSGAVTTWTGREVLIWGGRTSSTTYASVGRRYDPVSNEWSFLSRTGQLSNRLDAASAWTGLQWIIWGGWDGLNSLDDGIRYLPSSDQWLPLPSSGLLGRFGAGSFWLGDKLLIVGGRYGAQLGANDYALYDVATNAWSQTNFAGGCLGYTDGAVTDRYVVIRSESGWCRYDIENDQWSNVSAYPDGRSLPARTESSIMSTGGELVVYGTDPLTGNGVVDLYNPADDTWRQTINTPAWTYELGVYSTWTGCGIFSWNRTLNGVEAWQANP